MSKLPEQLPMDFGMDVVGRDVWQRELNWARKAVEAIGHKHVAFALDVAPSTLTDALHERERKGLKGEWLAVIRQMSSPGMQAEWLRIVAEPLGHETTRRKARTPEERLADLEKLLEQRLGDIGKALLEENRR